MKRWNLQLLVVAAAWLGLFPLAASATLITYDFSVTATSGPLSGTTANGSFTFDSSSIPASLPGETDATGLLTDLTFTWNGINYDETTANTGALEFDGAGDLIGAVFGNDCIAGVCEIFLGTEGWFFALQPLHPQDAQSFTYGVAGGEDFGFGTETLRQAGAVPEPATLALLGIGLAGLGFARRRKRT